MSDVIPEESRVNSISGSKPRPRKVRFLVKFEEDAKEKSGDIRHETENLVKNPVDGVDGVDGVAGEAVEAGEEVRHEPAAPRLPSEEAGSPTLHSRRKQHKDSNQDRFDTPADRKASPSSDSDYEMEESEAESVDSKVLEFGTSLFTEIIEREMTLMRYGLQNLIKVSHQQHITFVEQAESMAEFEEKIKRSNAAVLEQIRADILSTAEKIRTSILGRLMDEVEEA